MATAKRLCASCQITKSFTLKNIPVKYNYRPVSNTSHNKILEGILANLAKLKKDSRYIILVDGSRYGIEITQVTKTKINAKQYFLHYDGEKGKLIAVNVRFVEIILDQ